MVAKAHDICCHAYKTHVCTHRAGFAGQAAQWVQFCQLNHLIDCPDREVPAALVLTPKARRWV